MARAARWGLVGLIVVIVAVVPFVWFRVLYVHSKRLRVVVPGRFYRSGQMSAAGLADAVRDLGLRTIINVQDDVPDPDLDASYWTTRTVKESELCQSLEVRYVPLAPDLLDRRVAPPCRPRAIEEFLAIMDDPASYPVLLHCRAGLHRTGVLTAVYRMEYQGWQPLDAWREMRANGFGPWAGTSANEYVRQYVLTFRAGERHAVLPRTLRAPDPLP
jgi:protein tyrosine/serine phosphatase